jgi:AcrR family transcriptional regulator
MQPEDRRAAIVAAGVAVAQSKGLASMTARDVAAHMGTSSGLIHHYFDSMDDVLAEVFEQVAEEDLQRTMNEVGAATDPRSRLAAFFRSYAPEDGDSAYQLWLDAWAEAARRPALRTTSVALNRAWQQALAGLIDDAAEPGSAGAADPDGSAWRILSFLDGMALQVVAHRANIDRRTAIEWARKHTELELGLEPGSLALSRPRV